MTPSDTTSADLDPIFVSVKKAAAMLGITPWSIYELLKTDTLDARYYGKRRLVSVESVREYAANLPTERPDESA